MASHNHSSNIVFLGRLNEKYLGNGTKRWLLFTANKNSQDYVQRDAPIVVVFMDMTLKNRKKLEVYGQSIELYIKNRIHVRCYRIC